MLKSLFNSINSNHVYYKALTKYVDSKVLNSLDLKIRVRLVKVEINNVIYVVIFK